MTTLDPTAYSAELPLILASGSRYRQEQIKQLKLSAEPHPADIDETPIANESALQLALRLARAKAEYVALVRNQHSAADALIIGCDQTADCKGHLLHKPGTADIACEQLSWCSGHTVAFYSAICLLNSIDNTFQNDVVITEVKFRQLSNQQIHNYVAREQPLDCAGSFKCEGLGIALFERIRSDDPSALIGLPLIRLTDFLINAGRPPLI